MGICQSVDKKLNNFDDSIELFSLEGKKLRAKIVRVYDGDTCFAVFLLNNKPVKFKIRMDGYDSPEMKPPLAQENRDKEIKAANKAKEELQNLVLNKIVDLQCGKWDKYGRLLAKIYVDSNNKNIYVNYHMIKNVFGYPYEGGTKKQFS
jgi:endonuclease YncB( thermonuclease family)